MQRYWRLFAIFMSKQGRAKPSRHKMHPTKPTADGIASVLVHADGSTEFFPFEILAWLSKPEGSHVNDPDFRPYSIKRVVDGEVFTLADRVTNGTPLCGKILEFTMGQNMIFVRTDYSNVGINLDSCIKVPTLPCAHQMGDVVACKFVALNIPRAVVRQVHFIAGKVKYDLEIWLKGTSTRVYNVDEAILEKP